MEKADSGVTLVSITTCPRPDGASYLRSTAAALLREGATTCALRVIFCDGESVTVPPGWAIAGDRDQREDVKRDGSRLTMWRVFRFAVEQGVDRLLYCEDDIVPCRNAVRKMCAMRISDRVAFIDFHDMRRLIGTTQPGLRALALGSASYAYWGTQCMLFPRRTLDWLVREDPTAVAVKGLPHCADLALGALLARSPWPRYAAHLPCLVRHAGVVSAAHRGVALDHRLPTHYPGDECDALAMQ